MKNLLRRRYLNRFLWSIGIILLVLIAINAQYFWAQIKYYATPVSPASPAEAVPGPETGEPNQLNIPSLGITAPIQYATEKTEAAYQAALINGVVHYPETAQVGEVGNAYLFGHSSDYVWSPGHYKTVFALLPKIQIGAEITASNADGRVFHYRVADKSVVTPDDLSVLNQDTGGEKILTLQTSYPVGTALKRYIVKAVLVEE